MADRLVMLAKGALTPEQLAEVEERISLPEHRDDEGPTRGWRTYSSGLYAFFQPDNGRLVALVCGFEEARPGWWVDSAYRGQGYGGAVVDLLAARYKASGVTAIRWITIATRDHRYDRQSTRLAQRLRRHFEG